MECSRQIPILKFSAQEEEASIEQVKLENLRFNQKPRQLNGLSNFFMFFFFAFFKYSFNWYRLQNSIDECKH